jgi:hypothetical protein
MTTAAPDSPACGYGGVMLEVTDPADVRTVVAEVPAMPASEVVAAYTRAGFRDSGSAFKEQGSPGLRFYTRIKTAAVRFAW